MIRIQNIYYMLAYSFQILNEQGYKNVLTEEFENATELCTEILIKGVSYQLKKGLYKEYINFEDKLTTPKGKIDISSSVKQLTTKNHRLVCEYDEFSLDCYVNQIIKTTFTILLKNDISDERKTKIKKLYPYFNDVAVIPVNRLNWNLKFNRNNQTYQLIIAVCYLILNGLLQTNTDGTTKLMDFLDERKMHSLYEKFILEYYKKEHPELDMVSASKIAWNLDDGFCEMLPEMKSDVMISKGDKTLIIDAKYYENSTQTHFDKQTLHSNNLYQIYTYVKNHDKNYTGNTSGLLLYAKTDENIINKCTYSLGGNKISADVLDLNCDFSCIKDKLDSIIVDYLY